MAKYEVGQGIIKMQRVILIVVLVFLVLDIVEGMILDKGIGHYLSYASVVLLIVAAPLRMIAVSRYFKERNDRHYQILSYIVILIIVLTAIVRALV